MVLEPAPDAMAIIGPFWRLGGEIPAREFARRPTAFAAKNEKRKGLQLALEPLNGQGIAGYVPEP